MRLTRFAASILALCTFAAPVWADDAPWAVVGKQGMVINVIVPQEQSRDGAAYLRQIPAICGGNETCFINFYTNSHGAEVALPLPEAIAAESTAVLRRSAKQGVDKLLWSCRMQMEEPDCF